MSPTGTSTGGKSSDELKTPIHSTDSLPENSSAPISGSPTSAPTGDDQQNNNQTKGLSLRVVVIVGGVIGGLGILAAAGAGFWIFLGMHKKSKGEADRKHGMQPPRM
jgi:hypothetical protein